MTESVEKSAVRSPKFTVCKKKRKNRCYSYQKYIKRRLISPKTKSKLKRRRLDKIKQSVYVLQIRDDAVQEKPDSQSKKNEARSRNRVCESTNYPRHAAAFSPTEYDPPTCPR